MSSAKPCLGFTPMVSCVIDPGGNCHLMEANAQRLAMQHHVLCSVPEIMSHCISTANFCAHVQVTMKGEFTFGIYSRGSVNHGCVTEQNDTKHLWTDYYGYLATAENNDESKQLLRQR